MIDITAVIKKYESDLAQLRSERDELREKLAVAVEALEWLAQYSRPHLIADQVAKDALEKIAKLAAKQD